MKKLLILLSLGGLAFASDHIMEKEHHRWCKENWQECKQRMLSHMKEKEKCVQGANSFEEYRECKRKLRGSHRKEYW